MNNIGIIAEYNPFHNGHSYHLSETRKASNCDNIIVIMSGNFVQRGEPALYDKWIRAEMAIKGGADLVIELPFIFACNNAEYFAHGAVKILDKLKAVSAISFGSESGDLKDLEPLAEILSFESQEFKDELRDKLSEGISFPKARQEAVKAIRDEETASLLEGPNNILALEYLKQLKLQESVMEAMTVKRQGQDHYESATNIRKALKEGTGDIKDFLPASTLATMEDVDQGLGQDPVTDTEKLFPLIMYRALTASPEELGGILSSGEGLEYRLKKALSQSKTYEDLIKEVISKRYTETRIRRFLIHSLMSLTREDYFRMEAEGQLYARVLAFSQSGARLLREIKDREEADIPILTNINKETEKNNPMWEVLKYDIVASDIYNLCFNKGLYDRSDYVMKPFGPV